MKNGIILILFLVVLISASFITSPQIINADSINHKIKILEDDVKEVRRDQLNYKIEKDLLKETFSSNYNTVNTIITFVLAIFTIIGFFGLKNINTLKKEYFIELGDLRRLRVEFENESKNIKEVGKKLNDDLKRNLNEVQKQNKKIIVLEKIEIIKSLHSQKKYFESIEHINQALELSPNDTVVLHLKALAFLKLEEYSQAINVYEQILKLSPSDETALHNIAETYLFNGQIIDYKNISSRINKNNIKEYLDCLAFAVENNEDELKKRISTILSNNSNIENHLKINWNFDDVKKYLLNTPHNNVKDVFLFYLEFVQKKINTDQFLKLIG